MNTFVTGGSGFVGSNLIGILCGRGYSVRALVRSRKAAEVVRRVGATSINGDLANVEVLREGLSGCETVFHCAGILKFWKEKRLQVQVNIQGTRNLVTACLQSKVTCLVYISAAAVISTGGPIKAIDESIPVPRQPFGDYARTKAIFVTSKTAKDS